jgi:surfeit locus 1 family protein
MVGKPPPSTMTHVGTMFFGSLCAGTFALGVWQTRRYTEKVSLIEQRKSQLTVSPQPFFVSNTNNGQRRSLDSVHSFHRYHLMGGEFDYDHEFLVGPRGPPPGVLPNAPGSSGSGLSSSPQGYFVLTPYRLQNKSSDNGDLVVVVNRGWMPRHLVPKSIHNRRKNHATSHPQPESVPMWVRPRLAHNDSMMVVEGKSEEPRFMVPEHDLVDGVIPRLYWFDQLTMKKLSLCKPMSAQEMSSTDVPYVILVRDEKDEQGVLHGNKESTSNLISTFPVAPTAASISEFKVSPAVHAGYAFTWYSLSAAGMYMTRLLLRGRG